MDISPQNLNLATHYSITERNAHLLQTEMVYKLDSEHLEFLIGVSTIQTVKDNLHTSWEMVGSFSRLEKVGKYLHPKLYTGRFALLLGFYCCGLLQYK